jgi:hypothetical protein
MKIQQYINDLKNLPEPKKTFMEIMKVHKSEVHMANLLAFFFRSEENHGLGKIFIEALLETDCYSLDLSEKGSKGILFNQRKKSINIADNKFIFEEVDCQKDITEFVNSLTKVNARTEYRTNKTENKQKRIDLVIYTKECVICIEFKINHDLNNPLETYQSQICKIEQDFQETDKRQRDLFFVVLTPFKKTPSDLVHQFIQKDDKKANRFSQIILSHFIKNVSKKIRNAEIESMQYIDDLIQTINNREIKFKRGEILKDLQSKLVKSNLNSVYHNNKNFIEIKKKLFNFKIRIKNNHQFQIEKWSKDNKREEPVFLFELSCANEYETILETLNNM